MKLNNSPPPILYSFRRCPYAIRSRLAIKISQTPVELREVLLSDKPAEIFAVSPKGTVPVLILSEGQIIDESLDIMLWALNNNNETDNLIQINDTDFKQHLDHYKYAQRFPEYPMQTYRNQLSKFLQLLEQRLNKHPHLSSSHFSISDAAIFPFIRQCAFVDKQWFKQAPYKKLNAWLETLLASKLFTAVMEKHPQWHSHTKGEIF